jgi:hypothetical protein
MIIKNIMKSIIWYKTTNWFNDVFPLLCMKTYINDIKIILNYNLT